MNKTNKEHKFKVGDRVRYYKKDNCFGMLPDVKSIGVIDHFSPNGYPCVDFSESGWSFDGDPAWPVQEENLELVNDNIGLNKNLTDEEIWTMLQPKMKKIGLVSPCSRVEIRSSDIPFFSTSHLTKQYDEEDVQRAIATAYRSGYGRAIKGRPFKIGKK